MNELQIGGERLTALAGPYLNRNDLSGLADVLRQAWSVECLELLFNSSEPEVVRTAAICVGLIGENPSAEPLAKLLNHEDADVVRAAEDALWTLWFRAAGPIAQNVLTRIVANISNGESDNAVQMLGELVRTFPQFAEAYHQRSQAYYFQNMYESALRDAQRACELNPLHFAAMANEAHALAALGRQQEALSVYRDVLRIHPRLAGIRSAILVLRQRLAPVQV